MAHTLKTVLTIETILAICLIVFNYSLRKEYRAFVSRYTKLFVLLTPIAAFSAQNAYLFDVLLLVGVAIGGNTSNRAAACFVTVLPLLPDLSRETSLGSYYVGPISTILAMSAGAFISALWTRRTVRLKRGISDLSVAALILIFLHIYTRDAEISGYLRTIVIFGLLYGGPYLLVSRGAAGATDVTRVICGLVLGSLIVSVIAVFQATRHWVLYQEMYTSLGVEIPLAGWTMAMRAGLLRTGGPMLSYSAAGVLLAVAITVLPFIRAAFSRLGYSFVFISLILGQLAAQSRGGWVAALIGMTAVAVYQRRFAAATAVGAFTALIEGIILSGLGPSRLNSIIGKSAEATGTLDYRKDLFQSGVGQIAAHPLMGQDPNSLASNMPEMLQGEHIVDFVNSHLYIAMTAGVPLFAVWVMMWALPTLRAVKLRPSPMEHNSLIGVPIAMILPSMVALTATSLIDRNLLWPVVGLALSQACFRPLSQTQNGAKRAIREPLVARLPSLAVAVVAR